VTPITKMPGRPPTDTAEWASKQPCPYAVVSAIWYICIEISIFLVNSKPRSKPSSSSKGRMAQNFSQSKEGRAVEARGLGPMLSIFTNFF
jgi:hypothetical protein